MTHKINLCKKPCEKAHAAILSFSFMRALAFDMHFSTTYMTVGRQVVYLVQYRPVFLSLLQMSLE